MIVKEEFKAGVKDIEKNGLISNKYILEILENIACYHSDMIGFGPLDVQATHISWILLEWQVQIINRPLYGEKLEAKTWARTFSKAFTYRDFVIYNKQGKECVIATSKWVLVDTISKRIIKIPKEIAQKYKPEENQVFPTSIIEKIEVPTEYESQIKYNVRRSDIDLNKHMHNIYYLDVADEALPNEVYENGPYNNFRITYKKGIKLGDIVICKYGFNKQKHIVEIKNQEEKVNAIIALWE